MNGSIARIIDTSPLKPSYTEDEVKKAIQDGIDNKCCSVCVQPCHIPMAVEMCAGTETKVCCVLDFPHGKSPIEVKRFMAETYSKMGARELDMVMNYGYALSGLWDKVEEEIRAVTDTAHKNGSIVKVIFEASQLDAAQIKKATEVSISAGADFVKTATGFFGEGAKEEELKVMIETAAGRCKVKASGGVHDYEKAKHFADIGVDRIGIGSANLEELMEQEKKYER